MKNGAKVDKVAIAFTRDNNLPATFEIQLSGGGGQFLTVYSGTVSEYGKLISYPFKGTTASDLRIVLNDDRVSIAEVKFNVLMCQYANVPMTMQHIQRSQLAH